MKKVVLLLCLVVFGLEAKDYTQKREVKRFINHMVKKHHFKRHYVAGLFKQVNVKQTPFAPKRRVKSKRSNLGPWCRYSQYVLTPQRVQEGKRFMKRYRHIFEKVEKRYGVEKEYIAAIIGVESAFGKNVGKFKVFDTLAVRSFGKKRRSKFYKKELEKFIVLAYRHGINPKSVYGSSSGAIGLGQFMPSNYTLFGVDYNKDGKVSMQHPADAIASIANYFKKHGWKKRGKVATRVSYKGKRFYGLKTGYKYAYNRRDLKGIHPKFGSWNYKGKVRLIKLKKKTYDELWYGAKNFYVITRYNHSSYYAMSVHQLAQKLKKAYR
jgi:membrane-bound lytic murein transglycosylase B